MTTYFTSDLHIGHRLVSGIRGFWLGDGEPGPNSVPDVDSHTGALIKSWRGIKPDDIVWILGDICISERTWGEALRVIRDYMPGRKRLICGNHDPVSSIHREAWKHQRAALDVFETVQDFAKIRLQGGTALLSHYPYSGLGAEGLRGVDQTQHTERYTEFRLTDTGIPLLHGHTHGPEKLHYSEAGTPEVHVGLDAWGMKLVSEHEIGLLLDSAESPARVKAARKKLFSR